MNSKEAVTTMDAIADIRKPPSQLLELVLQGLFSFSMNHFPKEVSSEDDPPLKLREGSEIIPIDEYLGLYISDRQEIIIYLKGIQAASDILRVNPEHLKIIVRLHEWAHAIIHLGVSEDDRLDILKDDSYWPVFFGESTDLFKQIDPELHELLAQALTLYCLQNLKADAKTDDGKKALNRIESTFHVLATRQPPEYQIDDLLDKPKERIIKSIGLLRNRWLVGKAEPWRTIVSW